MIEIKYAVIVLEIFKTNTKYDNSTQTQRIKNKIFVVCRLQGIVSCLLLCYFYQFSNLRYKKYFLIL